MYILISASGLEMDWRAVNFDWNRARAFLVTVEEGSLSAAARALGMAQPTLGRQVTALEKELGVTLFERRGRALELTTSGLGLLEHVRSMGAAAGSLSLAASGQADSVAGHISISASELTAVFILPPLIKKLRHLAPGIEIELVASNRESNLTRREADIAIRGFRPTQSELVARKLRDVEGRLYATTSYLEELGSPASPSDFANANFIGFDSTDALRSLLNSRGFTLTHKNFAISAESSLVQWELVKHGAAIGIMPALIGDLEPTVARVPIELESITGELWLVAHREVKTSRRVRTVFDFLVSELS